jgi:hypothetical protein
MVKHKYGVFITAGSVLVGLWTYVVIASFLGFIPKVWWGYEALLVPIIVSFYITPIAIISYIILAGLIRPLSRRLFKSYGYITLTGITVGLMYYLAAYVFNFVKEIIHGWEYLSDRVAFKLGLAISGLISVFVSYVLIFIFITIREKNKGTGRFNF